MLVGDPANNSTQRCFVVGFDPLGNGTNRSNDPTLINQNNAVFISRTVANPNPGFSVGVQALGGVIIGGYDNQIQATHEESVILGMNGQQSVAANTTHVDKFYVLNQADFGTTQDEATFTDNSVPSWGNVKNHAYQFQAFSVDSNSTTAAHITFRGQILIDDTSEVKDSNVSSVEWYYRDSTTSGAFVKAGAGGTLAQLKTYIDGNIGPSDNFSVRPLAIFSGTGLASVGFDFKILYR
jgi:hypothetical protein